MSVFHVPGNDRLPGALLDVAESDRRVAYLEGALYRSMKREWVVALISAAGWLTVVITNWGGLCRAARIAFESVGRAGAWG